MYTHPQDDPYAGMPSAKHQTWVPNPEESAKALAFMWTRKNRTSATLGSLTRPEIDKLEAWIHTALRKADLRRVAAWLDGDVESLRKLDARVAYLTKTRDAIAAVYRYRFLTSLRQRTSSKAPE